MHSFKFLPVMATAAILVGAASGTQAAPYAFAALSFSNLTLSGVVGAPGVNVTGATVTTSSSSNYPGQPANSFSAGGDLTTGSNTLPSFSGSTPAVGADVFTQQLLSGSATRGDARIAGAVNAGASANVVAEGRLTEVPGTAASTSGTSTGISIDIVVSGTTTVSLGFTASANLLASTTGFGEGSSAQTNASFSITQGSTTITNFAPSDLNFSVSSINGTGDSSFSSGPTQYASGPFVLTAGAYQIQLLSGSQNRLDTSAVNVPEPMSLSLLGLGLVGLGMLRRRRAA